ncbi:hypothetical protein AA313_de0204234 [Arthrobotrys entomopaga]|nr:hypothetical protein AA313_de0204234 [Arthrobotrys entomopaga]
MDTTGHTLTTFVYNLVRNPRIEKVLLDELKQVMESPNAEITQEAVDRLPVLTAVVKESLRLSYGVPGPLHRDVPTGGVTFLGHHLPAGTNLQLPTYTYHTNATVFPDPMRWDPTRWLVDDTREMERYYMPFTKGSRMCLGMNLALSELVITISRLVRRFEIGLEEGFRDEDMVWKAVFLPVTKGRLRVWVKEREA